MAGTPILPEILSGGAQAIETVEMHTTGEPTRIVYSGFPELQGETLLQKRADAKRSHDHVRARLMLEPRGHREMYGALLVNETELTARGEADIGVLFMHNEGWSTMCGHATIALGRFLVDFEPAACPGLFPSRNLRLDTASMTTAITLHCPCGPVHITVPVTKDAQGKLRSDPDRNVSFINVDSFATGLDVEVALPETHRWPELGDRKSVTVDMCYGGAFYCIIDVGELGFPNGLSGASVDALSRATGTLKAALNADPEHRKLFQHPTQPDLGFLYGIIIADRRESHATPGAAGGELGLCFFAAQQVDRSPCGSGVGARRALAHARGMAPADKWSYGCLLSLAHGGQGAFTAHVVGPAVASAESRGTAGDVVRVQIEGSAFYTGFATFVAEPADGIGSAGFSL